MGGLTGPTSLPLWYADYGQLRSSQLPAVCGQHRSSRPLTDPHSLSAARCCACCRWISVVRQLALIRRMVSDTVQMMRRAVGCEKRAAAAPCEGSVWCAHLPPLAHIFSSIVVFAMRLFFCCKESPEHEAVPGRRQHLVSGRMTLEHAEREQAGQSDKYFSILRHFPSCSFLLCHSMCVLSTLFSGADVDLNCS